MLLTLVTCRAGHGSEGDSILLGAVYSYHASDHRLVRKLYAAT